MEFKNVSDDKEYRAAESFNYTWRLRLTFLWKYLKVNFIILMLFIPEILKGIKNFVLPPKPKDISDQVVIVTGAGNGLGQAIAFRLAKEKCKLAIVDIDFNAAQQTANDIKRKFNISAIAFKVDVSRHQEIARLKEEVESTLGPVDILVNNAGLLCMDLSLREGTNEAIQKAVDVNLLSHFWVSVKKFRYGDKQVYVNLLQDCSHISQRNG
jgi:all-trans-retinol dehydrogenase (NAD+)